MHAATPQMAHHVICTAGKNLGPAKPCATMLWISMFWSLAGLHSFNKIYLPELEGTSQQFFLPDGSLCRASTLG